MAAWQPHLRAGPDGLVQTSFKLPDTLTRYRLTAVALTVAALVGLGVATAEEALTACPAHAKAKEPHAKTLRIAWREILSMTENDHAKP